MIAPNAKQRHPMVNLGTLPEPAAGFCTAPSLQPAKQLGVVARCIPQLPRRDAGRVPARIPVRSATPQVFVPAEAIYRLAAHAAEAGSTRERSLAVRSGRRPKACRQTAVAALAELPCPALGRAAAGRQRTGEPLGTERMGPPVTVDREPRHWWRPAPIESMGQHRRRKALRQGPGQAGKRARISRLAAFRHLHWCFRSTRNRDMLPAKRKGFVLCEIGAAKRGFADFPQEAAPAAGASGESFAPGLASYRPEGTRRGGRRGGPRTAPRLSPEIQLV